MGISNLIRFDDADALASAIAAAWMGEIAAANRDGKPHCVALSGGRITLKFFAAVTELVKSHNTSFTNVHFFWADERCVPPTDPESNFASADKQFFQPLGIPAGNIHRIRGEDAPDLAASESAAEILRIAPVNKDGQPALDLIFLGLGEDGHVASLFPREPDAMIADPAICRVIYDSPKPPPTRITLGYGTIAAARQVWVLASGAGKDAALRESLKPAGQTPLARVLRSRHATRIFTDIRID
jgi:6-phosphogluconolactonase